MDWRIILIEYIHRHPLQFSVTGTLIICTVGIIGLILELKTNTCVDDVKLWLFVSVLRLLFRLGLRVYIEAIMQRWISFRGSLLLLHKIMDIVDVFGFVWFAVGNLLVFNNVECAADAPVVFATSVAYIGLTYLSVLVPSLIKCSLSCIPPSSIEDRMYLLNLHSFEMRPGHQHPIGAFYMNQELGAELTSDQTSYWKRWLEQYDCHEFAYNAELFAKLLPVERQSQPTGEVEGQFPSQLSARHDDPNNKKVNNTMENNENNPHNMYDAIVSEVEDIPSQSPSQRIASDSLVDRAMTNSIVNENTVHLEGDKSEHICAICLTPFEEAAEEGNRNLNGGEGDIVNVPTSNYSITIRNSPTTVIPLPFPAHSGHSSTLIPSSEEQQQTPSTVEPANPRNNNNNNSIIVRYPCTNDHYFHAHCLQSWLQVSNNRGGNQYISCPCCRQSPRRPASSNPHSNSNPQVTIRNTSANDNHDDQTPSNDIESNNGVNRNQSLLVM